MMCGNVSDELGTMKSLRLSCIDLDIGSPGAA